MARRTCATTGEPLPRWWELTRHAPCDRALFVGLPGAGKSLQMVDAALSRMAAGTLVWANFELVHRPLGLRAGRVTSWDDFAAVCALPHRDKLVVLQEANLLCSSRQWSLLPPAVHKTWAQVRHFGVSMFMDAQHENRVDKVMREILDSVVICEPTGWKRRWHVPIYRQTWCAPEDAERARSFLRLDDTTLAGESNAVPPGNTKTLFIPGWVHTCYDTHQILEPWTYEEQEAVDLAMPSRWNGEGWEALGPAVQTSPDAPAHLEP